MDKKWIFGFVIAVLIVLIIIWYSPGDKNKNNVVCNYPYIQVGSECCLDEDSNSICDKDEEATYDNYKVLLHITSDDLNYNVKELPRSPSKIGNYYLYDTVNDNGEEFYGYEMLYLYTQDFKDNIYLEDLEENIRCEVIEYYDNVLSDKFTLELSYGIASQTMGYSVDKSPSEVRYEINCRGSESNIEFKDNYKFSMIYS